MSFKKIALPAIASLGLAYTIGAAADQLPLPVIDADYFYDGAPPQNKILLGKNLFWDKILSTDINISCGTCHNPQFGTGDNLSLPIGTGGDGGGMERVANTAISRIGRNSLSLYNDGAKEFTAYLNDGDVMLDSNGSLITPAAPGTLPNNLDNQLAAQALFPLTTPREMAGVDIRKPISQCASVGNNPCVWDALVLRLQDNAEYVSLFQEVYSDISSPSKIDISHIANAIAAYQTVAFRSDDSPFDKFLRGDNRAMNNKAVAGMNLFYGSVGCSNCHSGVFQTDHDFHAIAMPQIGPGRRNGAKDDGRLRITLNPADRHKYKTPSLRNVELTGPWGHDGAYTTLEGIVRHHLDPVTALNSYDTNQAILPPFPNAAITAIDFLEHNNLSARASRGDTNELAPATLTEDQIQQLLAFMSALTGDSAQDFKDKIPLSVLSGLPVAD